VPTILDDLSFFPAKSSSLVPGIGSVVIKGHQIIVWANLAAVSQRNLARQARRFPAILDTGNSFTFCDKCLVSLHSP
jgi:hypothetical protein